MRAEKLPVRLIAVVALIVGMKPDDYGATSAYETEERTAAYLHVARITAQTRRLRGKNWPPAYKFGRRVYYKVDEVKAWAEAQRIGAKP